MPDQPQTTKRERLEDERWELMNSYGHGSFHDGKVRDRIQAIDRELERADGKGPN